jgi:cell division protein FtsX
VVHLIAVVVVLSAVTMAWCVANVVLSALNVRNSRRNTRAAEANLNIYLALTDPEATEQTVQDAIRRHPDYPREGMPDASA